MAKEQRGPVGKAPTKEIRLKKGKVSDPDWHDVVLMIDSPNSADSIVQVKGSARLKNVVIRARMEFDGDALLDNVWANKQNYAVPVLASDPDMQQENNHKALKFSSGGVNLNHVAVQNNDDVIQLGKGVSFTATNSSFDLVLPYLGDHRDTMDADEVDLLHLYNCSVRGSGNSAIFCKQETASVQIKDLHVEQCRIENYKQDQPSKRQGHMVWLGYNVKKVTIWDNEWDARPLQTLLITKESKLADRHNVYFNSAPALGKRGTPRKPGQEIEVTYHSGR